LVVNKAGIATLNLPADAVDLTLKAHCPNHVPLEVRWSQENIPDRFTFTMSRGMPIGGIVHDQRGEPIEGVEVEGLLVSSQVAADGVVAPEVGGPLGATDAQGRWRAEVATAEPLELRLKLTHEDYFSDPSFGRRRVSNDELRSLEHVEVLDDRIVPQGVVKDARGNAIANAALYVLDGVEPFVVENGQPADDAVRPTAKSGAGGQYQFAQPTGSYAVLCLAEAGWAIVPSKRYEKNKLVDVALTAWSSLEGVLTEGDKPCGDEKLELHVHINADQRGSKFVEWTNHATTNAKGEFQFRRLTDGYASIGELVECCDGTDHQRRDFSNEFHASLAPGTNVKLPCVRSANEVTGTIVPLRYDGSEATLACGMIALTKEDEPTDMVRNFFFEWGRSTTVGMNFDPMENRAWATALPKPSYRGRIEADGSFRVRYIPPGSYRARVTLWCEGQADAEFEEDRKGGWHEGSIVEAFPVRPEDDQTTVKLGLLEVEVYSSEE
jgi:hypothetical protein